MFKFVTGNTGQSHPKRQQTQRACEPCRKRKKRCIHTTTSQSSHSPTQELANKSADISSTTGDETSCAREPQSEAVIRKETGAIPMVPSGNGQQATIEQEGRGTQTLENSINPTSQLPEPISISNGEGPQGLGSRFIGDLNPEGVFLAAMSPDATEGASLNDTIGVWLTTKLNGSSTAASTSLPADSPSSLFYRSSLLIQTVLRPVLEQECWSVIPSTPNLDSLSEIYFEKVHPLFPILDRESFRGLNRTEPSRILLQQAICLAASKDHTIRNKLTLDDPNVPLGCREFGNRLTAAMRLSIEMGLVTDRIVLVQVLALMSQFMDVKDGGDLASQYCGRAVHHLHSMGLQIKGRQDEAQNKYGTTLLCCVWAIDKTNAAIYGRPVLMHERDIARDLDQCFAEQEPCFLLLLQVTKLLDKVISLYRPSPSSDVLEDGFRPFEEMILDCGASQTATPLLATIETLYHAVSILSFPSKTDVTGRRSSPSYLRKSLSSLCLSSAISHDVREKLVLFPFVPYAISVALSIAYHDLRHEKIPMYRVRAQAQFQANCDVLSGLGDIFCSALSISEMGKKILKEMDRVFSTMTETSQNKTQQEGFGNRDFTAVEYPSMLGSKEYPADADTATLGSIRTPNIPAHDSDPTILGSMPDIDLFGMFDPEFDLNGIDACLEGILDPSFPMYPQ